MFTRADRLWEIGRMAKRAHGYWAPSTKASSPTEAEKQAIIKACEALIADFFKPKFLPKIKLTRWNLCHRHSRRLGRRALSIHPALQVRHGTQQGRGIRRSIRAARPCW